MPEPVKKPWRLLEATLKDTRKTKFQAAVLPFGATEAHNLHLPYGTDNYQIEALCDRACGYAWKKGARVALLPHIPYGCDQNLMEFPMTISIEQSWLDMLVKSVAESLEKHGVHKLIVVNGHGGNNFNQGIRSLYGRTKVFICALNFYTMMSDVGKEIFEYPGEHADEMETSLMQELAPHLVQMQDADDGATYPSRFEAANRGWVWYPRPFDRLTTNSGYGYPKKATAAKGRKYIAALEERMGGFFVDLARAKMDKDFPFDRSKPPGQRGKPGGGHA